MAGAALAIAVAAALAAAAGWKSSATTDEPYHLLAAYTHVVEGKGDLNPDKPPLAKLVSGLALWPLGLRGAEHPPVERLRHLASEVRLFLYANAASPEAILLRGRLPQLVFLVALLLGTYVLARDFFGESAGLVAVVALGFQPLVLGHAFLVHTDVAAAATWVWAFVFLHRWLSGARRAWIPLGVALGLSLSAKHSGVLLALFVVALSLAAWLWRRRRGEPVPRLAELAGALLVALVALHAAYWPAVRGSTVEETRRMIRLQAAQWPGTEGAVRTLERVAGVSLPLAHFGTGLLHLRETDRHGQGVNYFLGRVTREGHPGYLPVAFLLKVSAPFLLLLAWAVGTRKLAFDARDTLLLAPCLLYLLASLGSSYNIGARHLLPLLPLLAVFGSQVAGRLAGWRSLVAVAALAAPALLAFPHYLSHFSLVAGGSSRGARYLNDSNLDWGQDWRRLGERARASGWSPIFYVYIGTGDPAHDLGVATDALTETGPPRPGYYAVSSFAEAVGSEYLAQLGGVYQSRRLTALLELLRARGQRVGGAGTSLSVYRLGG